jgi:hypothetical protein
VAIIDWGDMCYCWRAAEVAIAMTYIMLLQPDAPVQAAGHVLVSTQDMHQGQHHGNSVVLCQIPPAFHAEVLATVAWLPNGLQW